MCAFSLKISMVTRALGARHMYKTRSQITLPHIFRLECACSARYLFENLALIIGEILIERYRLTLKYEVFYKKASISFFANGGKLNIYRIHNIRK